MPAVRTLRTAHTCQGPCPAVKSSHETRSPPLLRGPGQHVLIMEEKPRQLTRAWRVTQSLMGVGAHLALSVPYLRRAHGAEHLNPKQRYLFVSNHVSLLDTIL